MGISVMLTNVNLPWFVSCVNFTALRDTWKLLKHYYWVSM
jgi:hypothetical protein